MRRLVPLLTALAGCALVASRAEAQACVGLPSFDGHPIHVNATAEFPEAATAYAAGVGLGKANGPFGTLGGGQVTFDDFTGKATYGFAEAGWQIPLGQLEVCPIGGATYAKGPNDDLLGIQSSGWSVSGGGAVGFSLAAGPARLIPNVSLRFDHSSQTSEEEGLGSFTETYDSTFLGLGLALVLANRISLQPLANIPVSGDDAEGDPTFGVFVSVGLP